jgi:hypothetical protein
MKSNKEENIGANIITGSHFLPLCERRLVVSMRKLLTASGVNDDNIRTEEFTGY